MPFLLQRILIVSFLFIGCNTAYQPSLELESKSLNEQTEKAPKVPNYIYPIDSVVDYIPKVINSVASKERRQLKSFYSQNSLNPIWTSDSLINSGIQFVLTSRFHGLNPNEYEGLIIDSLFTAWKKERADYYTLAKLDVQLSKAILKFTDALLYGKLNPRNFHAGWNYEKRSIENKDSLIKNYIKQGRTGELEQIFAPQNTGYWQLKKTLTKLYQEQELQTWQSITYPSFIVTPGDSNKYVAALKQRLQVSDGVSWKYSPVLHDSIIAFQTKHGLTADGKPGKKTYAFLAWLPERYIEAIKVNMERLRWLAQAPDADGLFVNIPACQLQLKNHDSLYFASKIIVGKAKNETPVFQSEIDYLVFNPCWTVPNSIAVDKMLPRIKQDSLYLQNRNMFIGVNGIEQDLDSIDFKQYSKTNFPFKIYQRSDPGNALGEVKFMFKNEYSIYLHDTPNKNLFNKDERAFSQGCVRVQNALPMANVILYSWDNHQKPITYYLNKGYPIKVFLKKPLPVRLLYLTCLYNKNTRQVHYYKDIYAKDYKVLMALEKIE